VNQLLAGVLVCPRCRQGSLALERAGWMCGACSSGWRARLALLTQHLAREAAGMRAELAAGIAAAATRRRLEHVAQAHDDQIRRLRAVLEPLGPETTADEAMLQALGTQLPTLQGLTNYYVNLHRDWAWGEEENRATVEAVRAVLGGDLAGLGISLVAGAGGGRLAYDLHQGGDAPLTLATDFNPLLLFAAREIFAGRSVELWEFPIAPRDIESHAVLRRLAAPSAARAGLELVGADALQPPFADGAFDTVVTPWFIDIIGESFERVAARVNLALKPGGRWINFGSLAFSRAAHGERLSLEEILERLPAAGFAEPVTREMQMPYMRSPASRHARVESTVSWVTRKAGAATSQPRSRELPVWLQRADQPVPRTRAFEMQAVSSRLNAFLLALINGERSMRDMAAMIVQQKLMAPEEAEHAVRRFLTRLHEDSELG
jgi:hypothetical protein